jgi:hypothetical protein
MPLLPLKSSIIQKYLPDLERQLSVVAPTFVKIRITVRNRAQIIFEGLNSRFGRILILLHFIWEMEPDSEIKFYLIERKISNLNLIRTVLLTNL